MRKYLNIFFKLFLIITIFFSGSRVLAASGVEITDISLHQKSDGVEVSNTTYSDSVLNTDPVLHNLNDYVTYKITIKNNDDVAHNILNVTDDNNSNYITTNYTHDNSIDANGTSEILMTIKLSKLVDDVSLLNSADVYSLGEINITLSLDDGTIVVNTNPKTGDTIIKYIALLLVSILTLVLVIMKKISKKSVMTIIISALFIGTGVLASTTINLQVKINQDSIQVKVDTYNVVDGEGNEYKYIGNVDQVLGVSEPTMDGYNFVGFSTTENGTVEYQNGDTINRTDNLVLYPVYEPTTYHITYELNGGKATNPTTYNIEENLTITNPTKEHYDFAGWTGTDLSSATMNLTIVSGTTGDKSYTATWTPVTYTITYNLDGGEANNPTTYNVESGNMTLSEPTKDGYTFAGWTGTGLNEATKNVVLVSSEGGNREYTATWTATTYHITYELNGGEANNPTTYNIEENLTITNPTKEHYDFAGWTGTDLSSATMNLTIVSGTTGDKSYTATWTPVTYTITYNLDGGETTNPTTYNVESGNMTLSYPTKNGYTFAGWTGTGLDSVTKNVILVSTDGGNREYTATWTPTIYTITYDLDGGIVTNANPESYNIETSTFTLWNPEREGYTFAGWVGTGLSTQTKNVTINPGSTGNRSYTATWTPVSYRIAYNLNGGEATNPTTYNVESEDITLNNPTKLGYEFTGWSGTGIDGKLINTTIPTGSTGNRIYSANWRPIDYEIDYEETYNSVFNPTTYTIESSDIPLMYPSRYGYRFTGWIGTDLNEPTMDVIINRGSVGDREYTATWALKEYQVTYIDGDITTNETITHGSEAPNKNVTGKTGYEFKFWSLTENGEAYDFSTPIITEITLFAVYKPINYTLTYNLDGGSMVTPNPATYNIESNDITLMNPTKAGHIFAGWTGTGLDSPTENVTIAAGSIGNRSYTATYYVDNHIVMFNDNGSVTNETVVDGEYATEIAPAGKTGYTFKHWSLNENGEAYNFNTPVTDNLTLYAVYEIINYTITYDLDGGSVHTANPTSYNVESNSITLYNPTKTGHTFAGWIGTGLDSASKNVTINKGSIGNRSYTATYTINTYTVTYNDQGVLTTETVNYGANAPEKAASGQEGYTFKHWSLSREGEAFDFSTGITGDITLFAVYEQN